MSSDRSWWRTPLALAAAVAVLFLLVAELALGSSTGARSNGILFLGRFHPLVVHLPIGIFVLVALGELAALVPRQRTRIDPVIGLVLPVLVASALVSFVLGHFLARSGDFPPQALAWHRRLAFVASLGAALSLGAWVRQSHASSAPSRLAYRALLFGSLGVLSLGAHFGGTMTRGETYLSKYAPDLLKPLLGGADAPKLAAIAPRREPVAEPRLFEHAVLPILQARCVECHGPEKVKGGLRLRTLAEIEKGGESGPAIVKGSSATSSLVKRLHLPLDDDERMPPKEKPQLSEAEIALIEYWIDRGATNEPKIRDLLSPANARPLLEKALEGAPATAAAVTPPAPASSAVRSKPEPTNERREVEAEPAPAVPAVTSEVTRAPSAPAPFSILAEKCEKCHGEIRQKGKLRVDSLGHLFQGGGEGPAVVAGYPEKSPLIQRVRLPLSSDEHMPPSEETQLTAREVATLTSFVRGLSREARPAVTLAAATAGLPAGAALATNESPGGVTPPASAPPATGQPSAPEPAEDAEPAEDTEPSEPGPATSATPSSTPAEPAPQAAVAARGGCAACALAPRPLDRGLSGLSLAVLAFGLWRRAARRSAESRS
jgi:uncharacterized membrane protein